MFKSAFNSQLACMTVLAIGAFALAPASLMVAEIVWVGGSALCAMLNRG